MIFIFFFFNFFFLIESLRVIVSRVVYCVACVPIIMPMMCWCSLVCWPVTSHRVNEMKNDSVQSNDSLMHEADVDVDADADVVDVNIITEEEEVQLMHSDVNTQLLQSTCMSLLKYTLYVLRRTGM